jgi:hypothetical protein
MCALNVRSFIDVFQFAAFATRQATMSAQSATATGGVCRSLAPSAFGVYVVTAVLQFVCGHLVLEGRPLRNGDDLTSGMRALYVLFEIVVGPALIVNVLLLRIGGVDPRRWRRMQTASAQRKRRAEVKAKMADADAAALAAAEKALDDLLDVTAQSTTNAVDHDDVNSDDRTAVDNESAAASSFASSMAALDAKAALARRS